MNIKDFTPVKGFESTHLINKYTQEVYSIIKNKILKGSLVGGYISYSIKNKEGKVVVKRLHRLMMETFNPDKSNFKYLSKEDRDKINLDNLVINHKDGNKLNNNLENLEWCTQAYNNAEAYRLGLRVVSEKTREQFIRDCHSEKHIEQGKLNLKKYKDKAIEKAKEINSIKIKLIKKDEVLYFDSCNDASKYLGVARSSVCRTLKRKNNYINDYKVERVS